MKKNLVTFTAALAGALMFGVSSAAVGANTTCTSPQGGGTISGNLVAGSGCVLDGTTVTGNVSVKSGGSLDAEGAMIGGNLEIAGTSGTNTICGTSIGGNLLVHNNTGQTNIGESCTNVNINPDNTVGGNVDVHNNTTTGPTTVTVANTAVGGNLNCHNDSPVAMDGGGNIVDGKTLGGECVTTVSEFCPAGGCDLSVSCPDGETFPSVTVPGGGNPGNLTLTCSAPPTNDGCGIVNSDKYPLPVIGSVVTVVPPGGYTAGNPIFVDIFYDAEVSVTAVCKSKNGNSPFKALPTCIWVGDDTAPTNVPCWEYAGEEVFNEVNVYMTSQDPAFTAH